VTISSNDGLRLVQEYESTWIDVGLRLDAKDGWLICMVDGDTFPASGAVLSVLEKRLADNPIVIRSKQERKAILN
jgi:hypothetical protein